MDRTAALSEIIYAARVERRSTTQAKRLVRAARALDLTEDERLYLFVRLEYCTPDGTPFGNVDRVW